MARNKWPLEYVPSNSLLTFIKKTSEPCLIEGVRINPKAIYLCVCGNTIETMINLVKTGQTRSCGCLKNLRPIDYIPHGSFLRFLKLFPHQTDSRLDKAEYKCECGNEYIAYVSNVKTGKTISCGCRRYLGTPTHGLCNHPLYGVWENMTSRCYNPKVKAYKDYGGRGITMCDEWRHSPSAFIEWGIKNGWEPGLEIDKDIKGGFMYAPEYCIFVTTKVNGNNKRSNRYIVFNNKTQTLSMWAKELGVSTVKLWYWLKKMSISEVYITKIIKDK